MMAEFTRPEYASYVSLMKDLRPEHKFREGDWLYMPDLEDALGWREGVYCYSGAADTMHVVPHLYEMPDEAVWLPQLADWLEKLEKAGRSDIGFEFYGGNLGWACGLLVEHECAGGRLSLVLSYSRSEAPTREEAAAKLWMAVTGK